MLVASCRPFLLAITKADRVTVNILSARQLTVKQIMLYKCESKRIIQFLMRCKLGIASLQSQA